MQHAVLIVVVGALLTQVSSVILAEEAPEVTGTYRCQGTDIAGRAYSGTAVIGKWGDAYHVQWKVGDRTMAIGVGLLTGNSLAVSYYGNATGVALYTIDDQRLIGHWTQPAAHGAVFTETLTRIPHDELHAPSKPSTDPAELPARRWRSLPIRIAPARLTIAGPTRSSSPLSSSAATGRDADTGR